MIPHHAREMREARLQAVPAKGSGSNAKAPALHSWDKLQTRWAEDQEAESWAWSSGWVGVILGPVSDGLECLDFDIPGKSSPGYAPGSLPAPLHDPWRELVGDLGGASILERLYGERSPSGGVHYFWRSERNREGSEPKVLARVPHEGKYAGAVELLSRGAYVVCAPTPAYEPFQGSLLELPVLSEDERELLLSAARMLDEQPPKEYLPSSRGTNDPAGTGRPGEDFNIRASWDEVLEGWTFTGRRWRGMELVRRPGKREGVSAAVGPMELGDRLWVWTSSSEFEPAQVYTKFGAYALLHHGGDFEAAARELSRRGYGTPRSSSARARGDFWGTNLPPAGYRPPPRPEELPALFEAMRAELGLSPSPTRPIEAGLEGPCVSEDPLEAPRSYPPPPPHLRARAIKWDEGIARAWAWDEYVKLRVRPSLPEGTTEACIRWVWGRWREGLPAEPPPAPKHYEREAERPAQAPPPEPFPEDEDEPEGEPYEGEEWWL